MFYIMPLKFLRISFNSSIFYISAIQENFFESTTTDEPWYNKLDSENSLLWCFRLFKSSKWKKKIIWIQVFKLPVALQNLIMSRLNTVHMHLSSWDPPIWILTTYKWDSEMIIRSHQRLSLPLFKMIFTV